MQVLKIYCYELSNLEIITRYQHECISTIFLILIPQVMEYGNSRDRTRILKSYTD